MSTEIPIQKLEEICRCIVCHTVPCAKILQCSNGHLTCHRCEAQLPCGRCPLCRVQDDKRTRNLAVEQIIESSNLTVVCDCGFSGTKKALSEHQNSCDPNNNSVGPPKTKYTGFGIFIQECWRRNRQNPDDEPSDSEVANFHAQCSLWWYDLTEEERNRFHKMAEMQNKWITTGVRPNLPD